MKRPGPSELSLYLAEVAKLAEGDDGIKFFWLIMPNQSIKERIDRAWGLVQSLGIGVICTHHMRCMIYSAPLACRVYFVPEHDRPELHLAGKTGKVYIFKECDIDAALVWREATIEAGSIL